MNHYLNLMASRQTPSRAAERRLARLARRRAGSTVRQEKDWGACLTPPTVTKGMSAVAVDALEPARL